MLKSLIELTRNFDLVVEHAAGYADLIRAEFRIALRARIVRGVAFAIAGLFALAALLCAAIVLTLITSGLVSSSWTAWSVPLACSFLALAAAAFAAMRRPPLLSSALSTQLREDAALVRAFAGKDDAP